MSSDEPPTRPPGRRPHHPPGQPRARHPDPHPGFPTDPDVTGEDVRRLPHPADRRDILLCIALGGALGGLGRWGLAEALPHESDALPWATVLANVSGCFAIGALFVVLADRRPGSRLLRPLLGTGVLGGYTTFSTYALDTRDLLAAGQPFLAAAYLVGTLVLGLLALMAAIRLTERMLR